MKRLLSASLFVMSCCAIAFAQEKLVLDHPIKKIAGVVQRESGETLPNIDVEVFGGQSLIDATKSNSHGKFSISVPNGEYEVWFTYKPHPVFKDVQYKVVVSGKGAKETWVVKMPPL
jgi:hypothetical protein